MSGRYVRASKFRHVFGEENKPDFIYTDVKALTSGDGNFIKVNPKYFAVSKNGGGGPIYVHNLEDFGRFPIQHPVINVQKSKVLDIDFHPFVDNIIATGSEDCSVAVTKFPEEGVTESITEADVILRGHTKKLALVTFHPTANNVLASVAYDRDVKVWDIEAQEEVLNMSGHDENVYDLQWSRDGSQMLTTCRDRIVRVFDPRVPDAVHEVESHQGSKTIRGFWVPEFNLIGSVGFTKTSQRKIMFWDPRNISEMVHRVDLDQAASVLCPFYDPDTSILYLAGKGDGTIRYFELTNDPEFQVHFISDFRTNTPQKGSAWMPKRGVDVTKAEIARFYRLTRDSVQPVAILCPRKNAADVFQEDIFPEAFAGEPAGDADTYFAGENMSPILKSLCPEGQGGGRSGRHGKAKAGRTKKPRFSAKKSTTDLEKELAEAEKIIADQAARIKLLTEQLAKLS